MARRKYLYPGNRAIREGRSGVRKRWVRRLQNELWRRGYRGFARDGNWGRQTKAAVRRFQRRHRLQPDGIPGVLTWGALFGPRSIRKAGPFGGRWPWLDLDPGVRYANDYLSRASNEVGRLLYVHHGRRLRCISGRRTLAEQRYLWQLYQSGRGNLAAYPNPNAPHIRNGGSAYDGGTVDRHGTYRRFFDDPHARRIGARHGLYRAVPSEAWHWQRY